MPRLYIVEQSALAVGGHYHAYTRTVALAARAIGLDVTILCNMRFAGEWDIEGVTSLPTFRHTWGEAEGLWIRNWIPGNIAFDIHSSFAKLPPKHGDHILLATIGFAELTAILEYLIDLPSDVDLPFFHLLLRYDPGIIRDGIDDYRPLFDKVARSAFLQRQVFWHTDTDRLNFEYSELTGLKFTTLPIPFDQEYLHKSLSERPPSREPLVITYLGDARGEKNFHFIPDAISYLWKDYISTGRARLVLQCNFNVEGGEPGILQSVQKLGQFPPELVELLQKPLSNEKYSETLANADIVLVTYDPHRYKSRSSSVLIEAMAAAKPVVTTAGSWMATQVDSDHAVVIEGREQLGPALKTIIDEFGDFSARAQQIAPGIMARATGESFVKELLASVATSPSVKHSSTRIMIIIDGDTLVQRNGAGFTALTQLRYLSKTQYSVCGIFIMNKRNLDVNQIESWTNELRDRIAEFDLERTFIVGSGRLSFNTRRQRAIREAEDFSIRGDLEQVRSFDVALDLVNYISSHEFDLIWLNYVTNAPLVEMLGLQNVPVLCETHDIQSFQKAIYAGRRVDQNEVATEIDLLSQFAHLISVSSAETAYLEKQISNVPITTTGIFPSGGSTPAHNLAGAKNLGEVVSSCQPAWRKFKWDDAWHENEVEEILRLANLPSLDLLYVSSNHVANISGLRWFIDEVYLPLLAPLGVSMIVAGSICEVFGSSQHDRLFFVGRLKHLAPIYAATRIVVLPILEGAGVAVKTAEALSFGRPIVATPFALRGFTDSNIGGVVSAETPRAFAEGVLKLLGSKNLRTSQARDARSTALNMISMMSYAELINSAFKDILGERAETVRLESEVPNLPSYSVEWDEMLMRLNRVIRNWFEFGTLETESLSFVATFPPDYVSSILNTMLDALLVTRSAFLLASQSSVRKIMARSREIGVNEARDLFSAAIDLFRDLQANHVIPSQISILFAPELALDVRVFIDRTSTVMSIEQGGTLDYRGNSIVLAPVSGGIVTGRLSSNNTEKKVLGAARLSLSASDASGYVISQSVPLIGNESNRKFNIEDEVFLIRGGLALSEGEVYKVKIPFVATPTRSTRWLDLVVFGPIDGLEVHIDDLQSPIQLVRHRGKQILRFKLPPHPRDDTFLTLLEISSATARVVIMRALIHVVVGDNPELSLRRCVEDNFSMSAQESTLFEDDFDLLSGLAYGKLINDVISGGNRGFPLKRNTVRALRNALLDRYPDLQSAAKDLQKKINDDKNNTANSNSLPIDLLTWLDAPAAIARNLVPGKISFVASRCISAEILATFDGVNGAASAKCISELEIGRPISTDGRSRRWLIPGEKGFQSRSWLRSFSLIDATTDRVLKPVSSEIIFRFPALLDLNTGGYVIDRLNFEAEDVGWAWTGKDVCGTITIPISLSSPGILSMRLVNLGKNELPNDVSISLNDSHYLTYSVSRDETGWLLTMPFESDPIATTDLKIFVRKHFIPSEDDPRTLGVAVAEIEFRLIV